ATRGPRGTGGPVAAVETGGWTTASRSSSGRGQPPELDSSGRALLTARTRRIKPACSAGGVRWVGGGGGVGVCGLFLAAPLSRFSFPVVTEVDTTREMWCEEPSPCSVLSCASVWV